MSLLDISNLSVHFGAADAVPVVDGDDAARLAARVLAQEHRVYPLAVRWFAEGRLHLADGKVVVAAPQDDDGALISPEVV